MFIYTRLKNQIEHDSPKTITVDVFDTILLRKNRSEQWHFWQYSKFASNVFKINKLSCSALLYFSLRNYYNYLLRSANLNLGKEFEASIDSLNKKIIVEVAKRNNKKLTSKATAQLARELVEAELKFESTQLVVNNKLITVLSESELPVYFLTDMYFSSHQIAELFQLLGLTLSVNGVSSADHNLGKSNGKSFIKLQQKYPNVRFKTNLHIGDHQVADVQAAKNIGMMVFWINLPLHRVKLLLSQYFFGVVVRLIVNQTLRKTNSSFKKETAKGLKSDNLEYRAKAVGKLFGPAVLHYCDYFAEFTNATGKTPIFVSSESITLSRFCGELGYKNIKTLPKFGRKRLLQSYVYQQRMAGVPYWASLKMVSKVQRRKSTFDALVSLDIINPKDTTYHLLGKNAYKEYLAKNSKSIDKKLKKVYNSTLREFRNIVKSNKLDSIILGDVGWNNTIQILLSELLKNEGYSEEITGQYMGLTGSNVFSNDIKTKSSGLLFNSLKGTSMYLYQPEVWESFLNTDNDNNSIREAILDGVSESINYYSKSDLSARDLYKAGRNVLIKHLADPNKKIIQVFSQLMFDYGTGNEAPVPMVNINYPKYFAYRLILRDRPRFKQFYYNQGWKWGAASWYHFRLLYRTWRKIKHKPSF